MKTYFKLLGAALVAVTTTNFVWFALTYWAYLSTKSVISTSVVAGVWLVAAALSANWFGSIVNHYKKKLAMLGSSVATLILFTAGWAFFNLSSESAFSTVASVPFWIFVLVLLFGVVAGSMYNIAIPTLIAFLVPEDRRDRANGVFGTVLGVSFAVTSVASGLALAFGGMSTVLLIGIGFTLLAGLALLLIRFDEPEAFHTGVDRPRRLDLRGTFQAMRAIPGLFALIFFTTFNNFLGGVFFALMDAYGLTLVSVQVWGVLWGFLSLSFIFAGIYIARKGLGKNLVRNLFRFNIVIWISSILFTIQPSIALLSAGLVVWLFCSPFIEATEQTVFQKVVPRERLGRVFGFAHSIEQAASPVTAFFIGPLAQLVFIPFMTTGAGVELIGDWFGAGPGRGMALVFILFGCIGLAVTILVMRMKPYKQLAARYAQPEQHQN